MAVSRYPANFRLREDILDQITPYVIVQGDIRAPAGPFYPADWLPVKWEQSNVAAGSDGFVCSVGKAVAFCNDASGGMVPAGMRTQLGGNAATSVFAGTVLTYSADDVKYRVTDLTTGEPVVAATTYSGGDVCDALIERGFVLEADAVAAGATVPAAADADVNKIIDLFISRPVGIASSNWYVYAGKPEDGTQKFTNYSKQSSIAYLTETQMVMPMRVAGSETDDEFDVATLDGGGTTTFTAGATIQATEYWEASEFSQITRYGAVSASANIVALGLGQVVVARNTDRTPFTCDTDGVLVRERTAITSISKEGDWYLDADVGVLFLSGDTWATQSAASATLTFSYSYYTDTGVATGHRFVHFDGRCMPGDFVVCDSQSNFTVASASDLAAIGTVCGRVSRKVIEPRDLLDKVKTAWLLSGMSSFGKMPGTATKGFSALVTFSPETVADTLVEVVFRAP